VVPRDSFDPCSSLRYGDVRAKYSVCDLEDCHPNFDTRLCSLGAGLHESTPHDIRVATVWGISTSPKSVTTQGPAGIHRELALLNLNEWPKYREREREG
jgi:hypothetical protein